MSSKNIKMLKKDWEKIRKYSNLIIKNLENIFLDVAKKKEKELYEGLLARLFFKFLRKVLLDFRETMEKINDSTEKFKKKEILLSIADLTNLKKQISIAKQTLRKDTVSTLKKLEFDLEDDFSQRILNDISNITDLLEQFEQMIQEIIDKK